MKNFKRVIATVLAAVMMMAMSVTAFAAESATITVKNAEDAILTYAQVIKQDNTTETGWAFTDAAYASTFKQNTNTTKDQEAIKAYIKASESERAAIIAGIPTNNTTGVVKNVITVSAAGLYVINATEEGYMYATMAAGIGMDYKNGSVSALTSQTINAKKEPTKVSKVAKDYTETLTEEFTYTVTTKVPYVLIKSNETLTGAKFAINDKLTGGVYAVDANGNLPVKVTVNGTVLKNITSVKVVDNSFELDLSNLIDASNSKANLPVVVEYNGIATSTIVENNAYPTIKGHKYNEENGFETEKKRTYSGIITIQKYDSESNVLAGAKFAVINEAGMYAKFDSEKMLIAWVSEDELTDDCYVITDKDGKAVVTGFDPTKSYTVREVEAPNGYSIIKEDTVVTWNNGNPLPEQPTVIYGNAEVHDSPLSQLPFTGGMGTTIFTVLGVAIMALASALYFATKRKASVN